MPLILPGNVGSATAATGYDVANSLRFNSGSSDYLNKTMGGSPTNTRKGTFSFWFKISTLATSAEKYIFSTFADSNNFTQLKINGSHQLEFQCREGGTTDLRFDTDQLFRDVSSWYNLVIAVDTTDGTAGNRVKIYLNGTQILSSFGTENTPSQNLQPHFLTGGIVRTIGAYGNGNNIGFDGYMSEIVFIDGSQEAVTSFGEFDNSGIWKPIDVSGLTFGTNGYYLDFEADGTNTAFVDSGPDARVITVANNVVHSFAQAKFGGSSIYLDGVNDKLTMPDSNDFDFGTGNFTWEAWIYKPLTGKESIYETRTSGSNNGFNLEFNAQNKFEWYDTSIASNNDLPRDPNAITANTWTHYAVVRNGAICTMYRDGTSVGTPLDVGTDANMVSAGQSIIGINAAGSEATSFEGFFDEMRLSSVARYTGNFTAPSAAFTSDSDTVFLIQSKASNLLGGDKSGVGNHFTTNNLTAVDQSIDTCTNNFCTWNPLANYTNGVAFSEGNLVAMSGTNDQWDSGRASMGFAKGKWYFECLFVAGVSTQYIGVVDESCKMNTANAHDEDGTTVFYNNSGGEIRKDGTATTADYGTFTSSQVAGIAIDADNFTISVYKGGSLIVDAYALSTTRTGFLFPMTTLLNNGDGVKVNFGSPPYSESGGNTDANGYGNFNQSVPSGYFAINTKNLAEHG